MIRLTKELSEVRSSNLAMVKYLDELKAIYETLDALKIPEFLSRNNYARRIRFGRQPAGKSSDFSFMN